MFSSAASAAAAAATAICNFQKPAFSPTHDPTHDPSLRPTSAPLSIAYVTSALVFDGVTATAWADDAATCDAVFQQAVVDSVDVVTQSSQVDQIAVADTDDARRRLSGGRLARGSGGLNAWLQRPSASVPALGRGLSSSTLVTFEMVVESDPGLTSLANASMVFKHLTAALLSAIDGGYLATAVATRARAAGSSVMASSSVNAAASLAAVARYSSYYEVVVNRYPTKDPTQQPAVASPGDDAPTDDVASAGYKRARNTLQRAPTVSRINPRFLSCADSCLLLPPPLTRAGGAPPTRGSSWSSRSRWPFPSRSAFAA